MRDLNLLVISWGFNSRGLENGRAAWLFLDLQTLDLQRRRSMENLKEAPGNKEKGIDVDDSETFKVDWLRSIPYLAIHAGCIAVIWVGISWIAVICAVLLLSLIHI